MTKLVFTPNPLVTSRGGGGGWDWANGWMLIPYCLTVEDKDWGLSVKLSSHLRLLLVSDRFLVMCTLRHRAVLWLEYQQATLTRCFCVSSPFFPQLIEKRKWNLALSFFAANVYSVQLSLPRKLELWHIISCYFKCKKNKYNTKTTTWSIP